jgi:low affinity Fe/Cu permease
VKDATPEIRQKTSAARSEPGQARTAQTPRQDRPSPFREAREQIAKTNTLSLWFSRFATRTAQLVGHPLMFLSAVVILVLWAVSGPVFHFSDTWQLIINTGTTIVTFLVVFLIQNTQNRDAKAIHLKLDELIRSHSPAHNDMIDIEKLSDEELDELEKRYAAIREQKTQEPGKGQADRAKNNPEA